MLDARLAAILNSQLDKVQLKNGDILTVLLPEAGNADDYKEVTAQLNEWFAGWQKHNQQPHTHMLVTFQGTAIGRINPAHLMAAGLVRRDQYDAIRLGVAEMLGGCKEMKDWVMVRRADWEQLKKVTA